MKYSMKYIILLVSLEVELENLIDYKKVLLSHNASTRHYESHNFVLLLFDEKKILVEHLI